MVVGGNEKALTRTNTKSEENCDKEVNLNLEEDATRMAKHLHKLACEAESRGWKTVDELEKALILRFELACNICINNGISWGLDTDEVRKFYGALQKIPGVIKEIEENKENYNSIAGRLMLPGGSVKGGGRGGGNFASQAITCILVMFMVSMMSLWTIHKYHEVNNEDLSGFILSSTMSASTTMAELTAKGMPLDEAAQEAAKAAFTTGISALSLSAAKNHELQQAVAKSIPVHCPLLNVGNDASKKKDGLTMSLHFVESLYRLTHRSNEPPGEGAQSKCFFGVAEDVLKRAREIIIKENNDNYYFIQTIEWIAHTTIELLGGLFVASRPHELMEVLKTGKGKSKIGLPLITGTIMWLGTSYLSLEWTSGGNKNKTRKARKSKARKSKTRKSKTHKSKSRKSKSHKAKSRKAKSRKSKARKMKSTRKRR